jgi:hypothetical protein
VAPGVDLRWNNLPWGDAPTSFTREDRGSGLGRLYPGDLTDEAGDLFDVLEPSRWFRAQWGQIKIQSKIPVREIAGAVGIIQIVDLVDELRPRKNPVCLRHMHLEQRFDFSSYVVQVGSVDVGI